MHPRSQRRERWVEYSSREGVGNGKWWLAALVEPEWPCVRGTGSGGIGAPLRRTERFVAGEDDRLVRQRQQSLARQPRLDPDRARVVRPDLVRRRPARARARERAGITGAGH